jgi:hypothetical protein
MADALAPFVRKSSSVSGYMVGDAPHGPRLRRRHLLPVGVAQPFDDLRELAAGFVELLGQLLGSRAHVPLLVRCGGL